MDFYKQFEELGRKRTVKEAQEIEKITRKEETRVYPHHSTAKKGTGEYFSTLNDKIIVKIFLNKILVTETYGKKSHFTRPRS